MQTTHKGCEPLYYPGPKKYPQPSYYLNPILQNGPVAFENLTIDEQIAMEQDEEQAKQACIARIVADA